MAINFGSIEEVKTNFARLRTTPPAEPAIIAGDLAKLSAQFIVAQKAAVMALGEEHCPKLAATYVAGSAITNISKCSAAASDYFNKLFSFEATAGISKPQGRDGR